MSDGPEWFAPKRYGYGSGLPIAWQGWVTLIGFVIVVIAEAYWLKDRPPLAIVAAIIPPTVAFILVCARTTRGGWRWRWGDED
jgi:hypothetical protein